MPVISHTADNGQFSNHIHVQSAQFLLPGCGCYFYGHPFHLVSLFQCFGHAFLLRHCRGNNVHTLVTGLVDFSQVLEQCSIQYQCAVKDRTVFFQIATAHPAPASHSPADW